MITGALLGKGFFYGFLMAFMIGPVFFTLIRTSISKGFLSGAELAFGVALSESFIIFISYISVASLADNIFFKSVMGVLGGAIMIIFGLLTFFQQIKKKRLVSQEYLIDNKSNDFRYILEGFMLNALNPFVYLFWIGAIGADILDGQYSTAQTVLLFSVTILVIFLTDLLKVYIADKISKYLNSRVLGTIDILVGIVLFGFGLRLLYFGLFGS